MTTMALTVMLPLLPTLVGTLVGTVSRRSRQLREAKDEGASLVEWVVITAIVVVAVVGIGAILVAKFTTKANELDLTTP